MALNEADYQAAIADYDRGAYNTLKAAADDYALPLSTLRHRYHGRAPRRVNPPKH